MRKWWQGIFSLGLVFCLVGCAPAVKQAKVPPITPAFSLKATVVQKEKTYFVQVSMPDLETFSLEFLEPKELSTLQIVQTPGTCKIQFLGLSVTKDLPFLPQTSMSHALFSVFSALQNPKQYIVEAGPQVYYYVGKTPGDVQFTCTVDAKTGKLQTLKIPNADLQITFT